MEYKLNQSGGSRKIKKSKEGCMASPTVKFKMNSKPFFLLFMTLLLCFGGQTAWAVVMTPQQNGYSWTPAQWVPTPYPQLVPPGYYPPSQDSSGGQRNVKPSGFIFIEVDPPDAEVFIDGNKLKPSKDNTYEEGVFTGMHKVVVKKSGYKDHLEIVTVSTGATQRLTVRLKPMN
jgi:hypothetical protein